MTDYILDLLADRGICASSRQEQERLEEGIAAYLLENGIREDASGAYYEKYVREQLASVAPGDLKAYLENYGLIRDAVQIAVEFRCDGSLPEERKRTLYRLLEDLHACGLGERYVPAAELRQALGIL